MVVKTLLVGISLWEAGMLYWLLCGTVLQKMYFRKKEWIILCVNIVGVGINEGINRGIIFFSQDMFIIGIIFTCTCICVMLINGQNKLLKMIIITLYYTMVALSDFLIAFASMAVLRHEFKEIVYIYANTLMESIVFACSRVLIAFCIYLIVRQKFEENYIREFQSVLLIVTIIMCIMLRYYQVSIIRMMYEGREQEAGVTGVRIIRSCLEIRRNGNIFSILCKRGGKRTRK